MNSCLGVANFKLISWLDESKNVLCGSALSKSWFSGGWEAINETPDFSNAFKALSIPILYIAAGGMSNPDLGKTFGELIG